MLSDKMLISLLEHMQAGIVVIDDQYQVVYTNPYIQSKCSLAGTELEGEGFFLLLIEDPEEIEALKEKIKKALKVPFFNYDLTFTVNADQKIFSKVNGSSFSYEGKKFVQLVITDVTGQKAFEQVIQAGYDNLQQTTIDLHQALEQIKKQKALLSEYKRKMSRELTIATSVQNAIIPTRFLNDSKLNIWGISSPSEELGGDYFDFFQLADNVMGILIADVVGHGVPAALIATMLKAYFEYYTKRYRAPDLVFHHVNQAMSEILEDTGLYLTAFYSVLDLNRMEIMSTSAGHDAALCFYSGDEVPVKLTDASNGTILGAFPESRYEFTTTRLKPGSRLLFFTDGITEARNDQDQFYGNKRLIDFINRTQEKNPEETVKALMQELDLFYGSLPPNDDRTIIVIDVLPEWQQIKVEKAKMDTARAYIRKRELDKAVDYLKDIINEDGKLTEAYIQMGKAYILKSMNEDAEEYLQKALVLDDKAHRAYYYLGIASYNMKQFSKARSCWEKVLSLVGSFKNTGKFLEQLDRKQSVK